MNTVDATHVESVSLSQQDTKKPEKIQSRSPRSLKDRFQKLASVTMLGVNLFTPFKEAATPQSRILDTAPTGNNTLLTVADNLEPGWTVRKNLDEPFDPGDYTPSNTPQRDAQNRNDSSTKEALSPLSSEKQTIPLALSFTLSAQDIQPFLSKVKDRLNQKTYTDFPKSGINLEIKDENDFKNLAEIMKSLPAGDTADLLAEITTFWNSTIIKDSTGKIIPEAFSVKVALTQNDNGTLDAVVYVNVSQDLETPSGKLLKGAVLATGVGMNPVPESEKVVSQMMFIKTGDIRTSIQEWDKSNGFRISDLLPADNSKKVLVQAQIGDNQQIIGILAFATDGQPIIFRSTVDDPNTSYPALRQKVILMPDEVMMSADTAKAPVDLGLTIVLAKETQLLQPTNGLEINIDTASFANAEVQLTSATILEKDKLQETNFVLELSRMILAKTDPKTAGKNLTEFIKNWRDMQKSGKSPVIHIVAQDIHTGAVIEQDIPLGTINASGNPEVSDGVTFAVTYFSASSPVPLGGKDYFQQTLLPDNMGNGLNSGVYLDPLDVNKIIIAISVASTRSSLWQEELKNLHGKVNEPNLINGFGTSLFFLTLPDDLQKQVIEGKSGSLQKLKLAIKNDRLKTDLFQKFLFSKSNNSNTFIHFEAILNPSIW